MDDVLADAFRRYYGQIYRYVRRGGSGHAEAEDLTQEVFAQAAASLQRLREDSRPLASWLYTVAQRRMTDETRRRARAARAQHYITPVDSEPPAYGPAVATALGRAMRQLPEPQRQIVVRPRPIDSGARPNVGPFRSGGDTYTRPYL
jgi:RNA polymerase sigma-70 factor (ECF subfamily)